MTAIREPGATSAWWMPWSAIAPTVAKAAHRVSTASGTGTTRLRGTATISACDA
ncbi:hypothetical protein [Streptomyces canus]|uniref:hypothetical protein n=1 Tax=Streptomyces canus TaxID=58343 RepID=UPI0027889CB0|nr:hypothetical protein [Streptomyces canus]MDQ1068994.1 hypothetical protein [Streptomyces canus]